MKIKLAHVALLLAAFGLPLSAFSQGSLTPPGAPAPTMKTLDQIETRTPISALPYTISTPGSYYVTTNLLVAVNDGIVITANNVTLDLNGFTISSIQNPAATGKAIALGSGSGPVANITIRNGFITGSVTNNGATFGGRGFGYGIFQFAGLPPANVHVSGVTVSGCLYVGIHLGSSNTVVESCTVNTAGAYGIYAQSISGSTAMNCGLYGIYATDSANNCSGDGIINGTGIFAVIANNCRGTGSGTGAGLIATNANSCFGDALGSGAGLSCRTAINCNGTSSSGTGIAAITAINCSGSSGAQSGYGLYVNSAQNCFGSSSSSGIGIYATSSAIGCFGSSSGDTGLYAFIANSCHGTGPTPLNSTHNVNSY
jgi:hypothetical protein